VTVVPGITSAIAGPSAAGIPVTHRGITHEVVVVSGHIPPGHPDSLVNWQALAQMRGTIVLMMAVERLDVFTSALMDGGRAGDLPVAIIENATLGSQRLVRSTLSQAGADARTENVRPPAIVVIGPVAGFDAEAGSTGTARP
jgi:uroporphyrin-III C-methyltransferase/precorrin-2 dehydrogenase/sirohydrochlorin ferrochelatase